MMLRKDNGYVNAIVIDQVNDRITGRGPYHNVRNAAGSIRWFKIKMKRQFPNATHINFYGNKGNFLFQERYETEKKVDKKHKILKGNYLYYSFYITCYDKKLNEILLSQWDPL